MTKRVTDADRIGSATKTPIKLNRMRASALSKELPANPSRSDSWEARRRVSTDALLLAANGWKCAYDSLSRQQSSEAEEALEVATILRAVAHAMLRRAATPAREANDSAHKFLSALNRTARAYLEGQMAAMSEAQDPPDKVLTLSDRVVTWLAKNPDSPKSSIATALQVEDQESSGAAALQVQGSDVAIAVDKLVRTGRVISTSRDGYSVTNIVWTHVDGSREVVAYAPLKHEKGTSHRTQIIEVVLTRIALELHKEPSDEELASGLIGALRIVLGQPFLLDLGISQFHEGNDADSRATLLKMVRRGRAGLPRARDFDGHMVNAETLLRRALMKLGAPKDRAKAVFHWRDKRKKRQG